MSAEGASVEIVLKNRAEERPRLVEALGKFAQEHQLATTVVQASDLALEEHLTNILNYAYEDDCLHEIRVRLALDRDSLTIEVEDDGKPFNPLGRSDVDTTAPLEGRPIGGLGIHLIRKFMDDVQYRRQGEKNVLRMRKRLAGPKAV